MTFEEFRAKVRAEPIQRILQKYIFGSTPICFGGDIDLDIKLKLKISDFWGIHPKNLEIVGSAKTGFSLNPDRLGKPFNSQSDIDIIVVSNKLFDQAWRELLQLDFKWYKLSQGEQAELQSAYATVHRGFISPDRLPKKTVVCTDWWKQFNMLSNDSEFGLRKIRGRLFKSWWFAEKYYTQTVLEIQKMEKK